MNEQSEWFLPGLVLAGSALFGLMYAFWSARRGRTVKDAERLRSDHEQALSALRELQTEKHLYDAATFDAQKQRLEQAAVESMRALEHAPRASRVVVSKAAVVPETAALRRAKLVGAAWGAAVVGFLFSAGLFVNMQSKTGADPRYDAVVVLSAISLSTQDEEKAKQTLDFWGRYMQRPAPRPRPPMLKEITDFIDARVGETQP